MNDSLWKDCQYLNAPSDLEAHIFCSLTACMHALDFALQISSINTNNTITNGGSIENRLKLYGTGWTGSYLES